MNKNMLFVFVFSLFVAGCVTTQHVEEAVNYHFNNESFDSFVESCGPPQSSYQLDNGGYVYTWSSGAAYVPLSQGYDVQYNGNGNFSATSTGIGGVFLDCTMRITTTKSKNITNITIMRDTIGVHESTRCAEFFKPLVKIYDSREK